MNTGDLKILHKKCPNKVDFPDVILNFSKLLCGWPSTLCLTGKLCPLRFIWHHDIKVTHCQSSAMTFVFTQCSFYNSIRHGLITVRTKVSHFVIIEMNIMEHKKIPVRKRKMKVKIRFSENNLETR